MTTQINYIFSLLIAFIFAFIMDFATNYYTFDEGEIRVGGIISINKEQYQPIEIHNYKNNLVNDLKISIPSETDMMKISTSNPVIIKKQTDFISLPNTYIIAISSIPGSSITRLMIPFKNKNDDCCNVLNYKELNYSLKTDSNVLDIIKESFSKGVQTAIIYSILFFLFSLWLSNVMDKSKKEIKQIRKELNDSSKELNDTSRELKKESEENLEKIKELRILYKRQRIFLLRRISDYSKEIQFWRKSIEKILLKEVCDKETVKKMLREISKSIKTLSTHGNTEEEYEDFEVLSNVILSIEEKENKRGS